jgi:putative ATP-dependent endonuclease of OLD family
MKIDTVKIKNYRLLKDFEIDFEDELSLVVGKNNTGKTSLLKVMNKFLNKSDKTRFAFDDFNIELKEDLKKLIREDLKKETYLSRGISLELLIKYEENDSLANISRILMSLDPEHFYILVKFEFSLDYNSAKELKNNFLAFELEETSKKTKDDKYTKKDFFYFLQSNLELYFKYSAKSYSCSKDDGSIDESGDIPLDLKDGISLKNIINFKYVSAKRDVTNAEVDKTLSRQTSKIYTKTESTSQHEEQVSKFKDALGNTDIELSNIYKELFKSTIENVRAFGGISVGESEISIKSTLQHQDLLKDNTTVMYSHESHSFPEYNNGLGYMNLISIIFEIEILVQDFKRKQSETPADINFLFIEEPEAHTHPQMQYVFIKNIKQLLGKGIVRDDNKNRKLQYVISTHSPHIVSESDFDDIKYLKRESTSSVIAKSLKTLKNEYEGKGDDKAYKFLKQYLTLNKSELFFADKAILMEGDTERILLPAMMKKIDQIDGENPLLSQNISLVEVGAYSHIFEKFIDFIGLKKCLIITDIDSFYLIDKIDKEGKVEKHQNENIKKKTIQCQPLHPKATSTSNDSLKFFHGKKSNLSYYLDLKNDWKILRKNRKKEWVSNKEGNVLLVYQTTENSYCARSFEDAFFSINKAFVIDENNNFPSLKPKYLKQYKDGDIEHFCFSEKAIIKKPSFAMEILMNSETDNKGNQFSNWEIPAYIQEGLNWLKKD